ncbi:MAG: MFS transporter [Thermodesulfobacteriota bacterium]
MNKPDLLSHQDPHRWMVFFTICMVYFFVYFHRVSTSVIVKDLLNAFDTNATALGFMSSIYFYIYAFEQPLVGFLSDRLGPRRVIGWWSIGAALGCFIFAAAPNILWASLGRALIGFGVGGVYVPAIKAFSLWFQKKDFATVLGFLMSVGNLGAVIATTPLAWATDAYGWRPTFLLIGGITLLLSILTFTLTRDHDSSISADRFNSTPDSAPSKGSRRIFVQILLSWKFWMISLIFFGIYGTVLTLQGLWATPFLMSALGIERIPASRLNMLIPIGVIVGSPLIGWILDRFSFNKQNTVMAIIVLYALPWVGIIFFPETLGILGLSMLFFIMGVMTGGFISTFWGFVRDTTPSDIFGLTSGMLNPAPFFGVAVFQVLTGAVLDKAGRIGDLYPLSAYKHAFLICFFSILVCLALSLVLRRMKELR